MFTYLYFIKRRTKHLRCQYYLTHILGHLFFPFTKISPNLISRQFFTRTPKIQNYLEKSVFLLIFLHNRLEIQFDLLMGSQLWIMNLRKLFQKLQNKEKVLLFFEDESSFDCFHKYQHFFISRHLFLNIKRSI